MRFPPHSAYAARYLRTYMSVWDMCCRGCGIARVWAGVSVYCYNFHFLSSSLTIQFSHTVGLGRSCLGRCMSLFAYSLDQVGNGLHVQTILEQFEQHVNGLITTPTFEELENFKDHCGTREEWLELLESKRMNRERERERERDASACMRRHQAFVLAPVQTHEYRLKQKGLICFGRWRRTVIGLRPPEKRRRRTGVRTLAAGASAFTTTSNLTSTLIS